MKRIKYMCFYDVQNSKYNRYNCLASSNKMDYIISVLNRNGIGVDLISFSSTLNTKLGWDKGENRYIDEFNRLIIFPSLSAPKIIHVLARYLRTTCYFLWLLFTLKTDETILVYHSLGYVRLFYILRFFRRIRIIGEIEEKYQDVSPKSTLEKYFEYKFIDICDKYIFPTELLNEKLNTQNKPHIIIHGIYSVEENRNVSFQDGKTHVVYAGTFDSNKGGLVAVTAAEYLPANYHVHICGFGNEHEIANLKSDIAKVSQRTSATITYDGLLKGEEFITFLQKCDVGLSTQNPQASFNATSFPSKILTYLANGLSVVSIRIPAIEKSAVGDLISFYDIQTGKEIAQAILNIQKKDKSSSINRLSELDHKFERNLLSILKYNL